MSHGFPSQPQSARPRRGGGGGLMLLIVIAAVAFFMFSRSSSSSNPGGSNETGIQRGNAEGLDDDSVTRGTNDPFDSDSGQAMPGTGRDKTAAGWDAADAGPSGNPMPSSSNKKVVGDDGWSTEQVETAPNNSGIDINLSNESSTTPRIENSDWESEQVPKKKSVTNGDWQGAPVERKN